MLASSGRSDQEMPISPDSGRTVIVPLADSIVSRTSEMTAAVVDGSVWIRITRFPSIGSGRYSPSYACAVTSGRIDAAAPKAAAATASVAPWKERVP